MDPQNLNKASEANENASDRESSVESFHTNKSEPSITTESELIDIDDIELSDEESWLYESPKKVPLSDDKCDTMPKQLELSEDAKNCRVKESRHALLIKLNQLKYKGEEKRSKTDIHVSSHSTVDKPAEKNIEKNSSIKENDCSFDDAEKPTLSESKPVNVENEATAEFSDWKSHQVHDVVDVQKLAKLQEESLKQSTFKFLSQSGSQTSCSSPASPILASNLSKPASVEGLNRCYEKSTYTVTPLQGIKKQHHFSNSALNESPEYRCGSLPNINKGYYSLKSKKSKRPSEPKVSCPLPIYPKNVHNGSSVQLSSNPFSAYDDRQSNTLPSSYRMNSRRNSPSSRSNSLSRRDSSGLSPPMRRDSAPMSSSHLSLSSKNNYRKYSSPVPLNTVAISPTHAKAFAYSQSLRSPPGPDYHRATSHSPARRLPLSMVQHPQSPKKENTWRNGEMPPIPVKVPPKLQNRSGIPVPSASQQKQDGDFWSEDCY